MPAKMPPWNELSPGKQRSWVLAWVLFLGGAVVLLSGIGVAVWALFWGTPNDTRDTALAIALVFVGILGVLVGHNWMRQLFLAQTQGSHGPDWV